MKSIAPPLCIVIYLVCMPLEIRSFTTTHSCAEDVFNSLKEQRSDLETEFLLSNEKAKDTLREICNYYLYHKVHKILKLVDRETCRTDVPTTSDLKEIIFKSYVQLLDYLKMYEGKQIPSSFGKLNDIVITAAESNFDRIRDRVAISCLHTHPDKIE